LNCPSCKNDMGPFRFASKFKACPNCGQVAWLDESFVPPVVVKAPHNLLKEIPIDKLNELEHDQLMVKGRTR